MPNLKTAMMMELLKNRGSMLFMALFILALFQVSQPCAGLEVVEKKRSRFRKAGVEEKKESLEETVLKESLKVLKDPNLEETVLNFAKGDLEVATAAQTSAAVGAGEAKVVAHENGVDMLEEQAETDYEIARLSVPQTRVATEEARISNRKTQKTALEAAAVAKEAAKMASNAATLAGQAIIDQVKNEARGQATKAAEWAKKWKDRKAVRIADAVAAATQPFHLAMLRAQKAAQQTHEKAISAMNAAKDLAENAQKMAATAQAAQGAGKTYEATQLMITANGAMGGAANLKAWAEKLYGIANKINASIGDYQIREGLAAGHAAVTTQFNPPPPFPPAAAAASAA